MCQWSSLARALGAVFRYAYRGSRAQTAEAGHQVETDASFWSEAVTLMQINPVWEPHGRHQFSDGASFQHKCVNNL